MLQRGNDSWKGTYWIIRRGLSVEEDMALIGAPMRKQDCLIGSEEDNDSSSAQ